MKTSLMTLALVLCCSVCYAQVPKNEKRDDGICSEAACMNMPFKYTFCDKDGNAVYKCSDDPNNEPGLRLQKRRIPIIYDYSDWTLRPEVLGGDDRISFYEGIPDDPLNPPVEYPVFVSSSLTIAIAEAAQRWMRNLCPPQGPDAEYQDCSPITIRWTSVGENIGPLFAFTDFDIIGNTTFCGVDCGTVQIILNQEPLFTLQDDYGRPIRFIATEQTNYNRLPSRYGPYDYVYMDAYTLMVHEFGHWLGFEHSNTPDSYGNTCGDPNSIMHEVINNLQQKDLRWADECMFLKAYCCEDSKRRDITGEPRDPRDPDDPPYDGTKTVIADPVTPNITGFTVLPNPSCSGELVVHLALSDELGPGEVRLLDAAGKVVLRQQLESAKGEEVSLDVSGLSKGMYMVQVLFNGHAFSRKVIIE